MRRHMKKKPRAVPSKLYTTEAGESRKKAKTEQDVADPGPEEGEKVILEHVVEEDDGEAD